MTPPVPFAGLIVLTLTPLTLDEKLDAASCRRHLEFLVDAGVDGVFILGSTGEGPMLRSRERMAVVEHTQAAVAGRVPVICGALQISTSRIVEELERLAGHDLDGFVVTTPLYFRGFTEDASSATSRASPKRPTHRSCSTTSSSSPMSP